MSGINNAGCLRSWVFTTQVEAFGEYVEWQMRCNTAKEDEVDESGS
jgi:hypothetical protein